MQIFINLHVNDLKKSKDFFSNIGFQINPVFSDETATCIVFAENIFAMLLTHEKFKMFTPKDISDATKTSEVMTALSMESKKEVDNLVDLALASGATTTRPSEDHVFMYSRAFNDLDGHIWEIFWMDVGAFPKTE